MSRARTHSHRPPATWVIRSPSVELAVTHVGAQLGPVRFRAGKRWIDPLSIAPWAEESAGDRSIPPVLRMLRGDFLALAFGGNQTRYRGEKHEPHGETANSKWNRVGGDDRSLSLRLRTKIRTGEVRQSIRLADDHAAIYIQHTIAGMSGAMPIGRHLMIRCKSEGRLTIGGFTHGRTPPAPIERPAERGYSLLRYAERFDDLSNVTSAHGERIDLSRLPSTRGYEDLVQCAASPSTPFGWWTAVFPEERFLLFALKDRRVLPTTVLWLSNGGRHYAPWNGRHLDVVGIEDVCSYFHFGLAESTRPNDWTRENIPTSLRFSPHRPTSFGYVIGVVETPKAFERVADVVLLGNRLTFTDEDGRSVGTAIDADFVRSLSGSRD